MSGHHQKHLHELLSQDQEPFLLHDYLLHRLRPASPPLLPLSSPNTRHPPFPSLHGFSLKRLRFVPSSDPPKFPFSEFPSPVPPPPRSPCHRAAVSLLVPARTAALLLEAASRIQRSGSARLPRKRSFGGRIVGLVLKRFARRKSRSAKDGNEPSYFESPSGGCNHGIISGVEGNGTVCDEHFGSSSLPVETQECPCPEERPPELPSPSSASPKHAGEGNEGETNRCGDPCGASKGKNVDDEEEERQQFSPVSVLDPPFDDEDGESPVANCREGDPNRVDTDFDYDCSFAFVQRTKQQLLDKLQRFERLARLDPVELEKRMLESDDEEAKTENEDLLPLVFSCLRKSPDGISKLLMDLVAEEEEDSESRDHENGRSVVARVNKRLESWEEEGSQTIETIVDGELKARWEPGEEQFSLLEGEIEVGIFESLLEELTGRELESLK